MLWLNLWKLQMGDIEVGPAIEQVAAKPNEGLPLQPLPLLKQLPQEFEEMPVAEVIFVKICLFWDVDLAIF